jgi:hypothetical protein
LERFLNAEALALQPLPLHPYDTSEVGFRVCSMDGFIEWATNKYSVAYEHVGEILTVKATEKEVLVYGPDIRKIAVHERRPDSAHQVSELVQHRAHAKKVRYGLAPVRQTFVALGEATEDFLKGLQKSFPRNSGYHARYILLLKDNYNVDDIHRALLHAMRYHAYDCMAVERILKARFRPRTLEQCIQRKSAEQLRGALPRVGQRELAEYQVLLRTPHSQPSISQETCDAQEETPTGAEHRANPEDPQLPEGTETDEDG